MVSEEARSLIAEDSEQPSKGQEHPKRRLLVSLVTLSTLVVAGLFAAHAQRNFLPKLVAQGGWAKEVTTLSDGECDKYPYLKYEMPGAVTYNNLANKGPDSGKGEGLVYKTIDLGGGAGDEFDREVYLVINATNTDYEPFSSRLNGIQGRYGSINMNSGSKVDLIFSFFDRDTMEELVIPEFSMTFFDLDTGNDGTSREYVEVGGFASYHVAKDTELEIEKLPDERTKFTATKTGTGVDNPRDPSFLTELQRNRAVTFLFGPTKSLAVTLGATHGIGPRFFTFIGRPALLCSVRVQEDYEPPLADLTYTPPMEFPAHVHHGETFLSYEVSKGDKVKKGDVIATVSHGNDPPREIVAGDDGTVKELQSKLKSGDDLDMKLSEKVIAVIERPSLEPLAQGNGVVGGGPGKDTTQDITPRTAFKKWLVSKGDEVKKGDKVAVVERHGKEVEVESVDFGVVKEQQALAEGDLLASVPDANILTLAPIPALGPLGEDALAAGKVADSKERTFQEYKVKPGDIVKEGDPIAIVRNAEGQEETVPATAGGVISAVQDLDPGTPLARLEDGNLATTGKFPELPVEPGVAPVKLSGATGTPAPQEDEASTSAPPIGEEPLAEEEEFEKDGLKFVKYYVKPEDVVETGDKIAQVEDKEGKKHDIITPRPGVVKHVQEGLKDGMVLDEVMKDDTIATIDKLPSLKVTDNEKESPAPGSENWALKEWKVEEGDDVKEGDTIAVLEKPSSGEERKVVAGKSGSVTQRREHLKPGDEIEESTSDDDLATIGPKKPEVGFREEGVQVPSMGCTFKEWKVEMNQKVNFGDGIADVDCPSERRLANGRMLTEGRTITVPSPGMGWINYKADLQPGKTIKEQAASPTIAKVNLGVPWWLTLLALLLGLCCCFGCLYNIMKKPVPKKEPTPAPPPPQAQPEPKPEGLRLDFDEGDGTVHTYYAKYRPLGIKHKHEAPIISHGFTINSYAKQGLGVQKDWKLIRIDDLELNDSEDFDLISDTLNDHMKNFPVWPLPLEFKKDPADTEAQVVNFTERPLGVEFTNHAPIVVDKVHEDSPAEAGKVQAGWYLTKIGDFDVHENHDFRQVLKYFKEGVQGLRDTNKVFGAPENNNVS